MHCIEALAEGHKILWVDTVQVNLTNYFERYFLPVLSKIKNELWSWNVQQKKLKLLHGYMDMRSAEKPKNIEGFGYDDIVMNEAGIIFNDGEYLWQNCILPMTMDYHAKCYFVGTPKGKLSKSGKEHLYYTFYKKGLDPVANPDWISYKASSYDNPMLNPDDIKALESEVPALIREQEIGAEFIDVSLDAIFDETWFQTCKMPAKPEIIRTIISWDTAFKDGETNDYSVATVWVQTAENFVCISMFHGRLTFPKLLEKTEGLYKYYKPDVVVIEDKSSGQSLIQMFKQTTMPVVAYKIDRDKISRATAITPLLETGKVKFLDKPWFNDLRNQCVVFPLGEHDDIVDSMSMALLYMTQGGPAWDKKRNPITNKMNLKTSTLNGYDERIEKAPNPDSYEDTSYLPPDYPQPARYVSQRQRDTILHGYD
jgi:predicted phage terminase large subunit-like protein